jgi:hypothetical protein
MPHPINLAPGQLVAEPGYVVRGNWWTSTQATGLVYRVNGGSWLVATRATPWEISLASLPLVIGNNLFEAYWQYSGSAKSKTNAIWFVHDPAARIARSPASQTVGDGDTVVMEVVATGSGALSYRWQRNGLDLVDGGRVSGASTSRLTITNAELADQGDYSVVVWNAFSWAESGSAALTVLQRLRLSVIPPDRLELKWRGGPGVGLERATTLLLPDWTYVPESEGLDRMEISLLRPAGFYRLVKTGN